MRLFFKELYCVRNRNSAHQESGMVLFFLALSIFAIILLFVLALALPLIATDQARLQRIANFTGLGALEAYIRTTGDQPSRRTAALTRANAIANQNRLISSPDTLGGIGLAPTGGDGGRLYFGNFTQEDPGTDPCDDYPCFIEVGPGDQANATYLEINTESDNSLRGWLTGLFGQEEFQIGSSAVNTLVDTCMIHALDVSQSIVSQTHVRRRFYCENNNICGLSCDQTPPCDPVLNGTVLTHPFLNSDFYLNVGTPLTAANYPNHPHPFWPSLYRN